MRRNNRQLIIFCLLLALTVTGCSRGARYQVLTFFFTGVPPLDAPPESAETPTTAAVDPALARRDQILAERARARAMAPYTGPYSHGPYAAKDCEQCHEMSSAGGFGFGTSSADAKKTIVPGRFVLPREQLCVACHAGKGAAAVQAAGLRLHGPAWNCVVCHHPHSSPEPYFLKVKAEQLCLECHGDGFIHDTDLHTGLSDCLECHNPHLGRDAMMLRDDFRETF